MLTGEHACNAINWKASLFVWHEMTHFTWRRIPIFDVVSNLHEYSSTVQIFDVCNECLRFDFIKFNWDGIRWTRQEHHVWNFAYFFNWKIEAVASAFGSHLFFVMNIYMNDCVQCKGISQHHRISKSHTDPLRNAYGCWVNKLLSSNYKFAFRNIGP